MNNKTALISIIIPTFKRKKELARALKCALSQTYARKEIIVVDDNSNYPDYRKYVENTVSKHPGVILIQNNNNLGGALSRNEGIKRASGELIAFLDDDDECVPDRLDKQYKVYEKNKNNNLGLVYSNDRGINFNENIIYQHMLRIIVKTSAWLVPKSVLLELGCFEDLPSEQDTTLLFHILKAGYNIFFVPEELIIWNRHDSASGISGVKPKNIVGTEKLRELFRANYNLLDNKKQINNVEYSLSRRLLPKYLYNDRREEAKREVLHMISLKPFAPKTTKSIIKYLFPSIVKKIYSK